MPADTIRARAVAILTHLRMRLNRDDSGRLPCPILWVFARQRLDMWQRGHFPHERGSIGVHNLRMLTIRHKPNAPSLAEKQPLLVGQIVVLYG
jgi:hypothetical protein